MDIILVATLAQAGASLDAAKDQVESGSPFWSDISILQSKIEDLIEEEIVGSSRQTEEE